MINVGTDWMLRAIEEVVISVLEVLRPEDWPHSHDSGR